MQSYHGVKYVSYLEVSSDILWDHHKLQEICYELYILYYLLKYEV